MYITILKNYNYITLIMGSITKNTGSFISAMDINNTSNEVSNQALKNNRQLGNNLNVEHSWNQTSEDELITQFYFQLVRYKNLETLKEKLRFMIKKFSERDNEGKYKYEKQLLLLYSLIAHTRDIVEGKGEYNLAFMQIFVWFQYFPRLAVNALEKFVKFDDNTKHPYGSWKDIKNFCGYVKSEIETYVPKNEITEHPLIKTAIYILLSQIDEDIKNMNDKKSISLAAKWCPREKGKYNWLYNAIIKMTPFYSSYMETAKTDKQQKLAILKIKTRFRKILAKLNKYIDTVQIKMCSKTWSEIDFNNVSSKSMNIYKHSFLNKTKDNTVKYPNNEDRIICSENFEKFVENVTQNKNIDGKKDIMKGKRLDVYELVKEAYKTSNKDKTIINTINAQWETNRKNNVSNIGNIIPMADTSGSMTTNNCIPLFNSIGLSIRVSECTNEIFKNRILTFSAKPEWVKLDDEMTFTDKIEIVKGCNWGMNTNFYAAIKMILDTIIEHEVSPDKVKDMVLAVFSDMQIDYAGGNGAYSNINTMFEEIEKMYYEAGMNSKWKEPYSPPHILFWNLVGTDGFPSLSTEKNVTMLSGYNSSLLNEFANKGMECLENYTPYKMLCSLLEKERYTLMNEFIKNELNI